MRTPSELNIQLHIGKVNVKDPIDKWDMAYPNEILSLQNQIECNLVALCGIFSTTVKDAKQHQWCHVQGEINSLHMFIFNIK